MDTTFTQREHTCLSAYSLWFSTWCSCHLLSYLAQIYSPHQVHLTRMDLQNLQTRVEGWIGKLYFSVNTARSEQGRVKDIDTICSHDDLDCLSGLKTVQLVQQLQHSTLHLRVSSLSLHSWSSYWIHLIDENNAGRVLTSHHEQLSHHTRSLSNIFLHQLWTWNTNKRAVSVVSNGSCQKSLSRSWWSIHKHSLGLGNTQRFKNLWMLNG